jgi:hypothetical protein
MSIQELLTDIDPNLKIGGSENYESLNTKLTTLPFNYMTSNIYSTEIYSGYDDTGSKLQLHSSNTGTSVTNDFQHNLYGLIQLLDTILPIQTQQTPPFTIPKLNYNNTDIINSYSSLRDISNSIITNQNKEKITRNDIDKTKKNIDLQYNEIIIVIIILIILIIVTGVLNINNKKQYVKYILLIIIILFLITYIFNILFIQIEPFTTTPNLYGFDTFKTAVILLNSGEYNGELDNLPSVNNYYDVYYCLTKKAIETDTANTALNTLVTQYAIINMLHIFKNQNTTDYIIDIDKNLKKEINKYKYNNTVIGRSAKTQVEYYNDLYIKSLFYKDIVYLLIYITLISILLNIILIEFQYNRIFVGLYLFLFILGIFIYSFRYLIRVRTNPTNRYF